MATMKIPKIQLSSKIRKRRRLVKKTRYFRKDLKKYTVLSSGYVNSLRAEAKILGRHLESSKGVVKGRPSYLRKLAGPSATSHNFRDKTMATSVLGDLKTHSKVDIKAAIHNWGSTNKIDRSGLWFRRVPQLDKDNKPIVKKAGPVTKWEITNRDLARTIQIVRKGLGSLTKPINYRNVLSLSSSQNFYTRQYRKSVQAFKRRRRPNIKTGLGSLETWDKSSASRYGLGFHKSTTQLYGSQTKVFSRVHSPMISESQQFRSNSGGLVRLIQLPAASVPSLWIRPPHINIRRCAYRTLRGAKLPISTSYSIISNQAIEMSRLKSEVRFLPPWWVENRLSLLTDRLASSINSTKKMQFLRKSIPVESFGVGRFFKKVLIRTKKPEIIKKLKSLMPIVTSFGGDKRLARQHFKTRNKFREFINYSGRGKTRLIRRSVISTSRHVGPDLSFGIYQNHFRFGKQMIKVLPSNHYKLRTVMSGNKSNISSSRSFKKRLWLRNANRIC